MSCSQASEWREARKGREWGKKVEIWRKSKRVGN